MPPIRQGTSVLTFEQALTKLLSAARPVAEISTVSLSYAVRRVLATAQHSAVDVPPLNNSAMDGYAVRCADVPTAGICLPVSQRIPAGSMGDALQPGTVARIFTGAPLPPGADAVVMQECCDHGSDVVVINRLPRCGENIRRAGEDIAAGGEILKPGIRLRAQDIALAASAGLPELPVYRRLRVGIFCTGNELVQPGEALSQGAIYNANRYALRTLLESLGCEVQDLGSVPDNLVDTRDALRRAAADNDLIITSGGVSVGEEDHVKPAVEAEGRLDLWKIAIKPGKPLAFGEVRKAGGSAWFIGLPGNPVSAMLTFLVMVRPFILRLQGAADVTPQSFVMRADFAWPQPDGRAEFLRAKINSRGGLELFPNQGSAVLSSLCWGDGLVMNPPSQVISLGDSVCFLPFSELLQ